MDQSSVAIDGFGPVPVHRPASLTDVSDTVREARQQNQAVYPVGGGVHLGMGVPPSRPGIAIETTQLNRVIDYPARDMTITVQAGIRVQDLQNVLAQEKQQLPIDVARAEQATLGGILAVNASGPRRFGHGTLRDYLIGVSFINDEGQEIKSGGRVVKNVAGYDMCKLVVGSLGTLGIITQATLKLRPLPEAQAIVLVALPRTKIDELSNLIHGSRTLPCCVELWNQPAAVAASFERSTNECMAAIGFEDNEPAVAWQVEKLKTELQHAGFTDADVDLGADCGHLWRKLTDFSVRSEPVCRMRLSVPPQNLTALFERFAAEGAPWQIQAHAGNGIVRIQEDAGVGKDRFGKLFNDLLEFASRCDGHGVVEECPPEWKAGLPVWGLPRGDYWLMRRVKERLDPENLFNPGRFVDGI